MKKVIIVGGGVGGTIIANLLARKFRKDEVQVTLISDSKKHVYLPGCLRIIFGGTSPSSLERDERTLLSKRVNFVLAEAKRINLNERTVEIKDDKAYEYDFLVVATGARYVPSEIPGYSSAALHFYDVQNAQKLAYELSTFKRGRIVIGIASVPYRCPPAPLEFAFLLDEYLRRRGYREKVEIEYLSPVDGVFMIKSVEPVFARLLEERGISYRTFFNTESIDPNSKVVYSLEGESTKYDLLVMVPPHRGSRVIEESGIGDAGGWIPVDRVKLNIKGYDDAFAIGDATDLPVSKSGSAAHYQAKFLATRLERELKGQTNYKGEYDGHVSCFVETGYGKGLELDFSYNRPPRPSNPNRIAHIKKRALDYLYWYTVPRALV